MLKLLQKLGYAPRLAVWELTLQCNLRCRHCGSRAGAGRNDELTTEEALTLCKDLAQLGCTRCSLSGGEPLLRKDWPLICSALVEAGIETNMVTNGKLWNRDITRLALSVGLESAAFSIDGLQDTHTYVRRDSNHWKQVWNAIDLCKELGLTASVITMVHRRNLHELDELRALLVEHRVDRWQLQLGNPSGNMKDHLDMCIEPKDVLELVPKIAAMCRLPGNPRVFAGHNVGYYGEPEGVLRDYGGVIPFWIGCTAGCSVIGIESNGGIKGCLSLPSSLNHEDRFLEGNIRDTTLREIWNRRDAFAYNRQFRKERLGGVCASCEYAEICRGGCSWTSYSHTGRTSGNDYCYWAQYKLRQQKQSDAEQHRTTVSKQSPRRLPIVG